MYNLTLSLPVSVTGWWEMNNNMSAVFNHITSPYYDDYLDISTSWYTINSTQSFTLPSKFSVQVSGIYFSESLMGASIRRPYGMVSLGIRQEFEKNLGALNLNFTDVFRNNIWHWSIDSPQANFFNDIRMDFDAKSIQLTYTNSFGNNKFKSRSKRETGSAEDLKRVGG